MAKTTKRIKKGSQIADFNGSITRSYRTLKDYKKTRSISHQQEKFMANELSDKISGEPNNLRMSMSPVQAPAKHNESNDEDVAEFKLKHDVF